MQRVLLDNGSEEALRLFGGIMANESFPPSQRVRWFRSRFPRYRNEVPYLAMAKRLVELKSAAPEIRLAVVQSVFDWDDEWGPVHGPDAQRPPPRALTKRPARELAREIARSARSDLPLPTELDARIGAVLKELDALDSD